MAIDKEQENNTWQGQLRQRVINERDLFESLAESDNEDVADFAREILEEM